MPEIIITIHEDRLTIDGPLPYDYELVVHNHSGNPDLYPYTHARSDCRNEETDEEFDDRDDGPGIECFLYIEDARSGQQA
jgi:hypothetical protein